MRSITFTLLLLIISLSGFSQKKYDYNWIFGQEEHPLFGSEGIQLQFGESQREFKTFDSDLKFYIGATAISDPNTGELLFYTNGCAIITKEHEVMENGDGIGNETGQRLCESVGTSSPYKNIMILPDHYNDNAYYLIYKNRYDGVPAFKDIWYAYIDMNLNGDLGAVVSKNEVIVENIDMEARVLTASIHANGKDWHIVTLGANDDMIHSSIIDEDGPRYVGAQAIDIRAPGTGHCVFTPDGSQYICYATYAGLSLYDFDNVEGSFSNPRFYEPIVGSSQGIGGIVEVSPSGEYAYFGDRNQLYQIDLKTEEYHKIAEVSSEVGEEADRSFAYALRAPDCKIYISASYQSDAFHIIHEPDMPKELCRFEQSAFKTGVKRETGIMAYYPNYNFGDELVCDRTITSTRAVFKADVSVNLFPNPTNGDLKVSTEFSTYPVNAHLYHSNGKLLKDFIIEGEEASLDLNGLAAGVYVLSIEDGEGWILNKRLVKMD